MKFGISNPKTQSGFSQSRTEIPSIVDWMGINNVSALTLIFMMALTMASGMAVVLKEHENRTAFNELQELKDKGNDLEIKRGQLLIEQSTFGVEGRVEEKAINELKMQLPVPEEIVMVNYD